MKEMKLGRKALGIWFKGWGEDTQKVGQGFRCFEDGAVLH